MRLLMKKVSKVMAVMMNLLMMMKMLLKMMKLLMIKKTLMKMVRKTHEMKMSLWLEEVLSKRHLLVDGTNVVKSAGFC